MRGLSALALTLTGCASLKLQLPGAAEAALPAATALLSVAHPEATLRSVQLTAGDSGETPSATLTTRYRDARGEAVSRVTLTQVSASPCVVTLRSVQDTGVAPLTLPDERAPEAARAWLCERTGAELGMREAS
ncbi:MAG: hypothetical protein IPO67_11125 [Deltaproteobacteria bacterium]|nr:hypothetical protein [Deltaproteobacteria bacterium]